MANLNTEINIKFWDFIRLKPYKNILLTADAKIWLIGMAFLALLLSTSEGIIWGYLIENYFFPQEGQYIIPILIGCAFSIVIWLVDAQIVNMDLSYYDNQEEKQGVNKFKQFRKYILKYFWSKPTFVLSSRIAIILVSVYFTAPALTKLVLQDEVNALISKERFKLKTELYRKVDANYKIKVDSLSKIKSELEIELQKEIAGTRNITGNRAGYGSVAKKIEEEINDIQQQINKLDTVRQDEYKLIQNNNIDELKSKYNIYIEDITTASMREKAYKEVLKDKNNLFLSRIAKTAILLIFSAFLLFKFFQPKTVSNYFNNKMQDAHLEYRRSELDTLVLSVKLPIYNDNGGMSNHKFFDFYEHVYLPTLFDEFDKVKVQSYKQKYEKINFLKKELNKYTDELNLLKSEKNKEDDNIDKLNETLAFNKDEQSKIDLQISNYSAIIKSEYNNVETNEILKRSVERNNALKNEVNKIIQVLNKKQILVSDLEKDISKTNELVFKFNEKIAKLEMEMLEEV